MTANRFRPVSLKVGLTIVRYDCSSSSTCLLFRLFEPPASEPRLLDRQLRHTTLEALPCPLFESHHSRLGNDHASPESTSCLPVPLRVPTARATRDYPSTRRATLCYPSESICVVHRAPAWPGPRCECWGISNSGGGNGGGEGAGEDSAGLGRELERGGRRGGRGGRETDGEA